MAISFFDSATRGSGAVISHEPLSRPGEQQQVFAFRHRGHRRRRTRRLRHRDGTRSRGSRFASGFSTTSVQSGSSVCARICKDIPKVIAYCRKVFKDQVPFDYQLSEDDDALYCIEMTEKAFRSAGIQLSAADSSGRHGTRRRVSGPDVGLAVCFPVCAGTSADVRSGRCSSRATSAMGSGRRNN